MKHIQTIIITAAICVVALGSFVLFRTVPVSHLWKGYQVLYVASDTLTDAQVYAMLLQDGCKNVIAQVNQGSPIVSAYSPVQVQSADSYLNARNAFFHDKKNAAMVFYVPEGQDMALSRALRELNDVQGTSAGTDGAASFPWLSPIISFLFMAVCVFFAKRKGVLLPSLVFLGAFSLSRPLFTTSAAVCLATYGFFMLQKIWGRHGFSKSVTNPLFIICLAFPVVLLAVSSPLSALFYVIAVVSGFCALLLVALLKTVYDESHARHTFAPVLIRGARLVPLVERKERGIMLALVGAVAVILLVSLAGASLQTPSFDASQPTLPAPVSGNVRLPDWDDFLAWSWQTVTFPYRRMADAHVQMPVDGDRVSFTEYGEENGHITESERTVYVYNSAFRTSVADAVKNAPYPALEKMLLKQGKDARYSYATGGKAASERFGSVLLLVFLLIPAGIIGYFVVVRRHYGVSF